MRRPLAAAVAAAMALTAFSPAPSTVVAALAGTDTAPAATSAVAGPGVGGSMSSNIELVATLPTDSPGVGGRVHVMPDGQRRLYVSSVQGLRIYDIDDPTLPVLIGIFEIPNWENEDVSVSKDGKTVLMSEFTGTGYTYVFQVSDPVGPLGTVTIELGSALPLSAAHIVDCIDDACDYFYGSEGQTWDARNKKAVKELPAAQGWGQLIRSQMPGGTYAFASGHNVEIVGDVDIDGDGDLERVVAADTTPIVLMDASDPLAPKLLTTSEANAHGMLKTAYQHNTKIEGFANYQPRTLEDGPVVWKDGKPTNLREGELLLGNGETNFTGRCGSGSGPLTSWSAAGWEKGDKIRPIATFRPINGTYDGPDGSGGDPAVNAIGCSGHWFDVRPDDADAEDVIVAAGWYEHGTRVIRVDGQTGAFEQLGFFQPVTGSASASHWVVDDQGVFIVTIDYVRGVDILRYDPEAPVETTATFDRSWMLADTAVTELSAQKRWFCRLGAAAPGRDMTATTDGFAALADRR